MSVEPVPVTILTGFLGAGKSTLLSWILKGSHGKRIAVLQNERGMQLGIEEAMIVVDEKGDKSQEWIEFPNGCVCCTVKDDLLVTLEQLARRPDGQRFDYIIVETSGLADPAPLMEALWADSELDPAVRVDGVVCVCDACHISEHLQRTAEARAQLAVSDVALINRCDLTDEMTVSKAEDEIRNVNAECKVLKSSWGKVDLDEILGMRTLDTEREPQIRSWNDVRSECDGCSLGGHDGHDGHDHGKKKKRHDGDISTWQIEMEGKMDEEKLRSFLAEVLWEPQGWDVLRAKGAVSLQSSQYMCALQAVRAVWTIQPTPLLSQGKSRFVFIGRNLKPDVWLPKLKDCLFKSE